MNETLKFPLIKTPWASEGGTWRLWGPSWESTFQAHQVDLAIFRMTGEWTESIHADPMGFLVKTPTKWVFVSKV